MTDPVHVPGTAFLCLPVAPLPQPWPSRLREALRAREERSQDRRCKGASVRLTRRCTEKGNKERSPATAGVFARIDLSSGF